MKILLIIGLTVLVLIFTIHPFLAVNNPISSDILVVEGWIPDKGIKDAINEFKRGNYKYLITVGGPYAVEREYGKLVSTAEKSKNKIIEWGVNTNVIIAVSAQKVQRDRTKSYAEALKNWIEQSDLKISSLNVFTYGAHGRKTYVIYKKVFEPHYNIGVISAEPSDYYPALWFLSVQGIKWVVIDTIKFMYALFL